ncbi:MAG TPA: alpha/beta fold hydrolase [Candidatus Binataceae bacterium]
MQTQFHRLRFIAALIVAITTIHAPDASLGAPGGFAPSGKPRAAVTTPAVTETSWISMRGPSAFDRIGLHRLAAGSSAGPLILYLPGTNMNGALPLADPRHWLPLYLAVNGAEVWSLDYRTHFIAPQTPPDQLAELRGWTDAVFVSDIGAAVDFVLAKTGRGQLFIAGFSRGATFAYLYAAAHPEKVSGLVILDGFILRAGHMGGLKEQASRAYATDVGGRSLTFEKRKALLELVIRNPDAPAPIPKFRTVRENLEQVLYESRGFGGRGGLANAIGGYSDAVTLARVLITYDRYWPAVQDSEDPLTPALSGRLASSKIPVLAFASTNIGPRWPAQVKSAAAQTGDDPTVVVLSGWGHLDVLCGTHARAQVYAPVLAWLRRHAADEASGRAAGSWAASSAAASRPAPTSQNTAR